MQMRHVHLAATREKVLIVVVLLLVGLCVCILLCWTQ